MCETSKVLYRPMLDKFEHRRQAPLCRREAQSDIVVAVARGEAILYCVLVIQ